MCGHRHGFGERRYAEVEPRVPAYAGGRAETRPDTGPPAVAGPPDLLIGDRERERVVDLLKRATADGRLTIDEFGDRVEEVYRARTAADLRGALRQLPYDVPAPPHQAAPPPAPAGRVPLLPAGVPGTGFRPLLVVGIVLAVVALAGSGHVLAAWPLLWLLCVAGRRACR